MLSWQFAAALGRMEVVARLMALIVLHRRLSACLPELLDVRLVTQAADATAAQQPADAVL
jgi:hypothetical protein